MYALQAHVLPVQYRVHKFIIFSWSSGSPNRECRKKVRQPYETLANWLLNLFKCFRLSQNRSINVEIMHSLKIKILF